MKRSQEQKPLAISLTTSLLREVLRLLETFSLPESSVVGQALRLQGISRASYRVGFTSMFLGPEISLGSPQVGHGTV